MPSVYRPRRPRASPLWQVVHHCWSDFETGYEKRHRPIHGPLRRDAVDVVRQFHRCGDLAAGFTRLQCPDCGHERLLAFTCKTRHFCPSCHQRKVRSTGDWIARVLCFDVPHRQFAVPCGHSRHFGRALSLRLSVFTMPKPLRGIFRKRRKLLDHLFTTAIESLRDWMRVRLELPDGQLAAVAAVQTFGDYLNFHPHLHVLAASGLVDREGRFHVLPVEKRRGTEAFWTIERSEMDEPKVRPKGKAQPQSKAKPKPAGRARRAGRANQRIEPLAELFRHRFLALLRDEKLISERKLRQLLAWTHSGFSLDAGGKPVAPHDVEGRKRLAEYLLRAPFSLEKITWNESTGKVIYRSKRSWHTKRNFQIFEAVDFLAATVEHIPPKGQQCHAAKAETNWRSEIAWTEAKTKSNGEVLWALFEQEPRNGREAREKETGDGGGVEARATGEQSIRDSLHFARTGTTERPGAPTTLARSHHEGLG